MLSVFKLVLCKHGAFRELDRRPPFNFMHSQGLKSSKCSRLIFCNISVVLGTHFIIFVFLINLKFEGLSILREWSRGYVTISSL